jgi:predicted DNA-binding transcriptional regulator AlpA
VNLPFRLFDRHDIVALTGRTYPTLWMMMRRGEFPHGRVVGGKTVWTSSEIEAWINALPTRQLKPLKEDSR